MSFKSLIPWNSKKESKDISSPTDSFFGLRRELDRVFDSFFSDFDRFPSLTNWDTSLTSFRPKINLSETDKEIKIEAELPGMDEKDIEVTLKNNTLILKGEKKYKNEQKKDDYHYVESSYGSFTRAIELPEEIDQEKIEANFKNGLMSITIPKVEKPQSTAKKIEVKKS